MQGVFNIRKMSPRYVLDSSEMLLASSYSRWSIRLYIGPMKPA